MSDHALSSRLHDLKADAPDQSKQEIVQAVGDLSGFEVFGSQVLLGVYCRPAETKGGLKIGGKMQAEDVYQGRVGLILKIGPDAFRPVGDMADEEYAKLYNGRTPQVGDWVYHRPSEGVGCNLQGPGAQRLRITNRHGEDEYAREWFGWPCRNVYGADILGRVEDPAIIV